MSGVTDAALDLAPFAGAIAGDLWTPGSPGYEAGRGGFDTSADQRPDVVVAAADPRDVRAAVLMAGALGRPVGVKATGHGVVAPANGAVLIDTARLSGIVVDPERRVARVQAGATWAQVIEATVPYGLAPLVGSSPGVGAVSYVLGGGLGPLGRRFGFAADHVRGLDLVTADGRLLRVDEDHEPELFWAVRGAGRNFGVATEIEIGLFPVAELFGGGIFFPGERAADVVGTLLQVLPEAPDALSLSVALVSFPPLPFLPPQISGVYGCHVRVAHCGPPSEVTGLVDRIRTAAPVLLDTVQTMPFAAVASISGDPTQPQPASTMSSVIDRVDGDFVAALLEGVDASTPHVIELRHLGGALRHQPDPPNAVGQRDGLLNLFTAAYPPAFPALEAQRARHASVRGYGSGAALPNFLAGPHVTVDDVRTAYGEQLWPRLVDLKRLWDPDNVFRFNQNIPPEG
jgi:FAD/FMN-containing dehydrogenase